MPKVKARGNGQGSAYRQGSTWTAQVTYWVYDDDGVKHRRLRRKNGFKLKKDALDYIKELTNPDRPDGTTITFNALYNEWSGRALSSHIKRRRERLQGRIRQMLAYQCAPILRAEDIGLSTPN